METMIYVDGAKGSVEAMSTAICRVLDSIHANGFGGEVVASTMETLATSIKGHAIANIHNCVFNGDGSVEKETIARKEPTLDPASR